MQVETNIIKLIKEKHNCSFAGFAKALENHISWTESISRYRIYRWSKGDIIPPRFLSALEYFLSGETIKGLPPRKNQKKDENKA